MTRPKVRTALQGLKVVVVGLGRFGGGVGAVRFLASEGAEVTVMDLAAEADLKDSLSAIRDLEPGPRLILGRQDLRPCLEADLVVLNPAVKPSDPLVLGLEARGIPATSEIALFLERCEAPVLGVTGSNGKSTTASLSADLLKAAGARVHFGGNIGKSLLTALPDISPSDRVVLELSSAQTKDFARLGVGVQAACVSNLTPNHLDYHATFEEYAAAKRQLLETLPEGAWAVLPESLSDWKGGWRNALVSASAPKTPRPGAWIEGHVLHAALEGETLSFPMPENLRLVGPHNRANLLTALAGVLAIFPEAARNADALAEAVKRFEGLPHRLEFVAERDGVRFYNDSKATTPEAAITALNAFPAGTTHVIAGGYDKKVDLSVFASALKARAKAVYLIGATAGLIRDAIGGGGPGVVMAGTLEAAVSAAADRVKAGEVVLLSPASASYDQFRNYEERGEAFRKAVGISGARILPKFL